MTIRIAVIKAFMPQSKAPTVDKHHRSSSQRPQSSLFQRKQASDFGLKLYSLRSKLGVQLERWFRV